TTHVFSRTIILDFRRVYAHMRKAKTRQNSLNFPLDTLSEKKRRGPKWKVSASAVRGRADNWRTILAIVWSKLGPALEQATTESHVRAALASATPYQDEFVRHSALILNILKDPKFPKTQQGRIHFLADSAAGLGVVSPRRTRDICAAERVAANKKG